MLIKRMINNNDENIRNIYKIIQIPRLSQTVWHPPVGSTISGEERSTFSLPPSPGPAQKEKYEE